MCDVLLGTILLILAACPAKSSEFRQHTQPFWYSRPIGKGMVSRKLKRRPRRPSCPSTDPRRPTLRPRKPSRSKSTDPRRPQRRPRRPSRSMSKVPVWRSRAPKTDSRIIETLKAWPHSARWSSRAQVWHLDHRLWRPLQLLQLRRQVWHLDPLRLRRLLQQLQRSRLRLVMLRRLASVHVRPGVAPNTLRAKFDVSEFCHT